MARTTSEIAAMLADGLLLCWLSIAPLCWILRDGLGPDSVDSHGISAIYRFLLTFYCGPICAALLLGSLGIHRWLAAQRRDAS